MRDGMNIIMAKKLDACRKKIERKTKNNGKIRLDIKVLNDLVF